MSLQEVSTVLNRALKDVLTFLQGDNILGVGSVARIDAKLMFVMGTCCLRCVLVQVFSVYLVDKEIADG